MMIDKDVSKEFERVITELDGLRQRLAIVESKLIENQNHRFHSTLEDKYRHIQRWD
jgi:hypothetical protein